MEDYTLGLHVGSGATGRVVLARHKSGGTVAVKAMRKTDLVARGQAKHLVAESRLLESLSHPFVVRHVAAFQTPEHLLLAMEWLPGGDLYAELHAAGPLTRMSASFYCAQIVCVLSHLHERLLVYRDLKPGEI